MHLSLKAEMSSKVALTDDHVNGGVVEIESDRPVEGCSIFLLTLIILAYTTT